jgi:hypothetical protein
MSTDCNNYNMHYPRNDFFCSNKRCYDRYALIVGVKSIHTTLDDLIDAVTEFEKLDGCIYDVEEATPKYSTIYFDVHKDEPMTPDELVSFIPIALHQRGLEADAPYFVVYIPPNPWNNPYLELNGGYSTFELTINFKDKIIFKSEGAN